MTDLEMVKACAEAFGLKVIPAGARSPWNNAPLAYACYGLHGKFYCGVSDYDPLHNAAQALELVKRFRLTVVWTDRHLDGWLVRGWYSGKRTAMPILAEVDDADLNRAIVKCVAEMWRRK